MTQACEIEEPIIDRLRRTSYNVFPMHLILPITRGFAARRQASWLLWLFLVCAGSLSARAQAPIITGFSPSSGPVGTTVIINGSNLSPLFSVVFGGNVQAAGSFTSTQITVIVPSGAETGPITIATQNGSASTATNFTVGSTSSSPSFFNGETALANGVYYLAFPNGNYFGYYSYLTDPAYIYHFDLGYEYVFDAADGKSGVYFYDFASSDFFYTSPSFPFPYLYDFGLNSVVYYYPDPSNAGHYNTDGIRYFYVFNTGQIISK